MDGADKEPEKEMEPAKAVFPYWKTGGIILFIFFSLLVLAAPPDLRFPIILLCITGIILVVGYIIWSGDDVQPARDTVVIVSHGWCGGMGEAVLEPPEFSSIHYFKGLPVFMTGMTIHNYVRDLFSHSAPFPSREVQVPRQILIKGLIRLVKKTERNFSIPGGPFDTFWDAEIERLDEIKVWDGRGL